MARQRKHEMPEAKRAAYNAKQREYQRIARAGGRKGWPPGKRGQEWERLFVNAVRGVIGLEDLPVTTQWG